MKKLMALLLIVVILCSAPVVAGTEDATSQIFHIAYAAYDGFELFGKVEIPDGVFFIRATFFLPCNQFFVVIVPISREGLFELEIAVVCEYAAVVIVDSPAAVVPGNGVYYESAPVTLFYEVP